MLLEDKAAGLPQLLPTVVSPDTRYGVVFVGTLGMSSQGNPPPKLHPNCGPMRGGGHGLGWMAPSSWRGGGAWEGQGGGRKNRAQPKRRSRPPHAPATSHAHTSQRGYMGGGGGFERGEEAPSQPTHTPNGRS